MIPSRRFYTQLAGVVLMVLAMSALVGWAYHIDPLESALPGMNSLKPTNAIGFLLIGLCLVLRGQRSICTVTCRVTSLAVAAIGLAEIVQYGLDMDFGFDELLFAVPPGHSFSDQHPARMTPQAALEFLLLGLGLVELAFRRQLVLARGAIIAASIIAIVTITLYAMEGVLESFVWNRSLMGLNTSAGILVSCFGIFTLGNADSNTAPALNILHRRTLRFLAKFTALAVTVIVGTATALYWEQHTILDTVSAANLATARVISERIRATFMIADDQLRQVATMQKRHNLESYAEAINTAGDILERKGSDIDNIVLMDRNGDLVTNLQTGPVPSLNFADRTYFQRHKAGADHLISAPVQGRLQPGSFIPVSQAIRKTDGAFNGVLVATIDVNRLFNTLHVASANSNDNSTLYHLDGTMLARDPAIGIGEIDPNAGVFTALHHASSGTFITKSVIDGDRQLFSYAVVEGYPLVVSRGTPLAVVFAPWYNSVLLVASLVVFGLITYFHIGWRILRQTEALIWSEQRSRLFLRHASDGIHIVNSQGKLIEASDSFCQMLGYTRAEVLRMSVVDWDCKANPEFVSEKISHLLHHREVITFASQFRRKDGTFFDVEVSLTTAEFDGQPMIHCSARDITERLLAEKRMKVATKVFETAYEGIMVTDADNRIKAVNPAFTRFTGYKPEEVLGQNPRILASGLHGQDFYRTLWQSLFSSGVWQGEIWNKQKNGKVYAEWLTITTIQDHGDKPIEYVGIFSDITSRALEVEKAHHDALYDSLTDLPNRRYFADRLAQLINTATKESWLLALLFVDLDHFKPVNDSFGHGIGDQLLVEAAVRLKSCVRSSDIVARIGGDEFVVVIERLMTRRDATMVAENIVRAIARPFMIEDHEITISSSIGVAIFPDDGLNVETLIEQADNAMYTAKSNGRSRFHLATTGNLDPSDFNTPA